MFGLDLRFTARCGIFVQPRASLDRGKLDPAMLSYLYHRVRAIIPKFWREDALHSTRAVEQLTGYT
jgi:hypothetical protein